MDPRLAPECLERRRAVPAGSRCRGGAAPWSAWRRARSGARAADVSSSLERNMHFHLWPRLSVRTKLRLIIGLQSLGIVVGGSVAMQALSQSQAVTRVVVNQAAALSQLQSADIAHEGLRSIVYASLHDGDVDKVRLATEARQYSQRMRMALEHLGGIKIEPELQVGLAEGQGVAARFVETAERLIDTAMIDRRAAEARLPEFNRVFDELMAVFDHHTAVLRERNDRAVAQVEEVRTWALQFIAATVLAGLALTMAVIGWIGRSIRLSLQRIEGVASAVAAGDLERRAEAEATDEVGRLGHAVNAMADKLKQLLDQALGDAERHRFGAELNDALEMAESEADVYRVVQHAMGSVAPGSPMELLVSDSSRASLQRATGHGAVGCTVTSPYACQAVRRGSSLVFDNSQALNACPRLRDRPTACGAVSAVCVPLPFMGHALGVLHVTGPAGQAPSPRQVSQLVAVGTQAAARIGVVRAFEHTQLQASTDAATGLANRRAFEATIGELLRTKQPFALLMADLDRFKALNDTHGHPAGDAALRLFADTMKSIVRAQDTVARWGGEEFAVILPTTGADEAAEWAERARSALAAALTNGKVPRFTVSFGIADSTMGTCLEDLTRIADEALYRSKESGRDCATVGGPLAASESPGRQSSAHTAAVDPQTLHQTS
ncbi:MAG: hypothetical protein C0505_00530 [Leptothrix sp. (in: Bacteria)]|nr:hypothetical protein [Leptothrix sp. (in: b-proteobacteria)]